MPLGTNVPLVSGARIIMKIVITETITLPKKPKARYFSNKDEESALLLLAAGILEVLLAILLEYWLGRDKIDLSDERGSYANRTREIL